MSNNFFSPSKIVWFYKITVEKYCTVGHVTDGNIIQRKYIARWITKATDTHSEYVLPAAYPQQQ